MQHLQSRVSPRPHLSLAKRRSNDDNKDPRATKSRVYPSYFSPPKPSGLVITSLELGLVLTCGGWARELATPTTQKYTTNTLLNGTDCTYFLHRQRNYLCSRDRSQTMPGPDLYPGGSIQHSFKSDGSIQFSSIHWRSIQHNFKCQGSIQASAQFKMLMQHSSEVEMWGGHQPSSKCWGSIKPGFKNRGSIQLWRHQL